MEQIQNVQRPLENLVVLKHIFGFLPTDDWKRLRRVCKTWYSVSLSKWRQSLVLNLKVGTPFIYCYIQPKNEGISAPEFISLMQNQQGRKRKSISDSNFLQFRKQPYQNVKLESLELDLTNLERISASVFWNKFGPTIKHLVLHQVNVKTPDGTLTNLMRFLITKTPNLTSLRMIKIMCNSEQKFSQPWTMDLVHPNITAIETPTLDAVPLTCFPNLKDFTVHWGTLPLEWRARFPSNDNGGTTKNQIMNSSVQKLNLLKCELDTSIQFAALKHLAITQHSILPYIYMFGLVRKLGPLVQLHSQTLQILEYFGPRGDYFKITIALPALTHLRAWGKNAFEFLDFLNFTPNLQVLELDLHGFGKQKEMKKELPDGLPWVSGFDQLFPLEWETIHLNEILKQPMVELNNLQYLQIHYYLAPSFLSCLANWMPKVKIFKSVFNSDNFPIVCGNWPELEQLECMFGSKIVNEDITGMHQSNKKSLIDLKCLKSFNLHTECDSSMLSDDAVSAGFLRMPKLKDLSICVSPEFSTEAEHVLMQRIPNVRMYRNYSSNPVHQDWECCRDKTYKDYVLLGKSDDITLVDLTD